MDEGGAVMRAIQNVLQKIADQNQYASTKETMFLDEISRELVAVFERNEDYHSVESIIRQRDTARSRLEQLVRIVEEKVEGDTLQKPWSVPKRVWITWRNVAHASLVTRTSYTNLHQVGAATSAAGARKSPRGALRWILRKIVYGAKA
jgi:hypothetical protein